MGLESIKMIDVHLTGVKMYDYLKNRINDEMEKETFKSAIQNIKNLHEKIYHDVTQNIFGGLIYNEHEDDFNVDPGAILPHRCFNDIHDVFRRNSDLIVYCNKNLFFA